MSAEGADIFLADIGYGYILNVLSEKGSRLIEGQGLKDAAPGELEQAEAAARQAEAAMEKVLDVEGLKRGLDNLFDNPIWGANQRDVPWLRNLYLCLSDLSLL